MSSSVPRSARVLHVDDDPQLLDLAATLLERERESVTVETATSASEGLDCLDEGTVDCVVSDYDMPGMNGLEFLGAVREKYPDLPFILFTGKGSEEIASEAITAGVTDYLNKGTGTDQYTLLANRIENTVSQYRAERDLQRSTERLQKLYGGITDAIFVLDTNWLFTHLNERAEELLQRSEAELVGENVWDEFSAAVGTTFQEQYEKAMNERVPVAFEEFYPPLDTWFEVRAVPTEDGLTAHFRDISEKKERDRTIRTQNERLETIIGNAPLVLFAFDEDGTFTFSEGRGLDQLDLEAGELVGESVFDAYAETPQVVEDARQAIDGEKAHSTVRISDRYFEVWFRPMKNGTDTADQVIGVAIDATERIEQEHELERKTDLLERTQNIADIGGWELNPIDDELRWTEQVNRIHGVPPEYDPTLEEAIDFYHPEDTPIVEDAVGRAIEAGESFDEEFRLIAADDTQRWVRAQGEPRVEDGETILLRGVFQNITERKRTEDELRDERKFIDTVLDTLDDVFYVVDTSGRFVRWNDRLTDVTGYTDEEVGEMHPTEFFERAEQERIAATISEAFETGQASITADIHTKSGENIPHEFYGARVSDADGEVLGVCGIARDVTERIERERRYDAIFNQTFQFTGLMEPDGTLIEANETARRFGGIGPEDVIGEYIWDSYWWEISAEARERVHEAVERAAEGEFVRYEEEVKSAEDFAIIDFSIKPVTDEQGEVVLLIPEGRDITEMKEYEERLESRLAALENSIDGMAILDAEGHYTFVNQAHAAVYGYDNPEGFIGEHWEMCYDEAELERFEGEVMPTLETEGQWRGMATGTRRDGTTFPQEVSLTALDEGGLVCVVRDVTERIEREREVISTRDTLSTLLASIPAGVLAEDASRNVLFANDGFCELFDIDAPSEALVGADCQEAAESVKDLFVESERFIETNDEYVAEQTAAQRETFELIDGRTFERSATPISIEDDEDRFLWVYHDITERKQREREIEAQNERMEALHGMTTDLVSCRTKDEIYELTVNAAERILDLDLCYVGIVDGESIVPQAQSAPADPEYVQMMGVDEGIAGKTIRTGASHLIEDAATATDAKPAREEYRSAISIPIGEAGVFQAVSKEVGGFDERDRELAETLLATVRATIDRVEREEQLADREARIERERDRFATLFENIPDPSVTVDLEGGEPITRSVNEAFEDVLGYAPETAVGESLNDLIVPPDRTDEATAIDRDAADGEYVEADIRRQTADGERRDFLFRSVPIEQEGGREAFGIYTDVTDRREHERYRRRLYEITANAELVTDQIIEQALELGCEYLGMESGFLTHIENDTQRIVRANSPHEALQPGGECPLSEAYCRKTMEMDEPMTVAHAGASGWEGDPAYERFGLEAYLGAKLTVENDQYGTVCFADRTPRERDFSELERAFVDLLVRGVESTLERHKYETELERQNDQLGEFAGVISHDLRNPLTVADGYLELACETGEDEYFTKVGNAHNRMNAIIEDVLTLTRQGERIAETSRVGLAAVAEKAWENVATAGAKLVIAEDLGEVDADEGRLKQLFENLYRNAVEHAGKDITVRVGRYSAGFYVEDDGSGIPESELERVFESGYTTGEEGTGMGLSIVDTIATAHGWGVGVEEGAEGGARFKVQLGMTRGGSDGLLLSD